MVELYLPKWSWGCQGVADPNGHFRHTWTMWARMVGASGAARQGWMAAGTRMRETVEWGMRHQPQVDECVPHWTLGQWVLRTGSWVKSTLSWVDARLGPPSEWMRRLGPAPTHISIQCCWGKEDQAINGWWTREIWTWSLGLSELGCKRWP